MPLNFELYCGTCSLAVTSFRTKSSLGHGQFGGVHVGKWRTAKWEREVAIKMLDPTKSHQDDKVKFLQEAAIMAQFKHPNVIQLYGIVTDGEPVSVIGWLCICFGFDL